MNSKTSKSIRDRLRRAVGKSVNRVLSYASVYQEETRRTRLAGLSRIHQTANIGSSAGFANAIGISDCITVGANSAILGELIIFPQGGRISIGERSFIGPGTRIWSASSIKIGNYVLIAHNVNIHDNISHSLDWRERRAELDKVLPHLTLTPHSFDLKAKSITIEDDVWVGCGASVIGGIHIGRGAIIGAGTMVTKDVPAFSVVVGNPMRIVRALDRDDLLREIESTHAQ